MLRKVFMIILAVCLLAGCAAVPGETEPETTRGTPTEMTQEVTPETTQGANPETTEGDMRQYVYTDGAFCYHIPVVALPDVNADAINDKLYESYDRFLQTEVLTVPADERFWLGLTYEIGRKDDAVSVTVLRRGDCDLDSYDVYYISASTGKELTGDAVFAAFGMTAETGEATIRKAMETYWGQTPEETDPFFLEQKEKTLADSNINAVKPLITEKGELQFVGEFYSLAGADSYFYRFNAQGELLQMDCETHS